MLDTLNEVPAARLPSYVDLYWLPLGAGDAWGLVRTTGLVYERLAARRAHRATQPLYHSALEVCHGGSRFVIEMTPEWGLANGDRGVVREGPVGLRMLGHSRLFRYEVHRWLDGSIPDLGDAVGGGHRVSSSRDRAKLVLDLAPQFPDSTWGRDEQSTGEMWNSNSLTSWLLSRSGHVIDTIAPPGTGRAPGWSAGLAVAAREAAFATP